MNNKDDLYLNIPTNVKKISNNLEEVVTENSQSDDEEYEIKYINTLTVEEYIDYCKKNESYKIKDNVFDNSYEFICWNTNADGSGEEYLSSTMIKIENDLFLYSIYKSEKPQIQPIYENDYMITGFGQIDSEIEIIYPNGSITNTTVNKSGSFINIIPSSEVPIKSHSNVKIRQKEKNMLYSDKVIISVIPNLKSLN